MPTKTRAKKARKASSKKPPLRPKPAVTVANSPFAPGTKVGFHRPQDVEIERRIDREPFGKPVKTATVKKDGTLEVRGLDKGQWQAVGKVGETYRYVGFSVK